MTTYKICFRCRERLPAERFSVKRRDPDGTVAVRESNCRKCVNDAERIRRQERKLRLATAVPVDREKPVRLPIGPFREWLQQVIDRNGWNEFQAAVCLGFQQDAVRKWLHERQTVALDDADRAFCHMGEPYLLGELYPSLYEFDEDDEREAA